MPCPTTRAACRSNPPSRSPASRVARRAGRVGFRDRRPKAQPVSADARLVRAVVPARICLRTRALPEAPGPVPAECRGRQAGLAAPDLADLDLVAALGPVALDFRGPGAGPAAGARCADRVEPRHAETVNFTSSSVRAARRPDLLTCGCLRTTCRPADRSPDCRSGSPIPGLDFRRS